MTGWKRWAPFALGVVLIFVGMAEAWFGLLCADDLISTLESVDWFVAVVVVMLLLPGPLTIVANFHSLYTTDGFRPWASDLPKRTKVIAAVGLVAPLSWLVAWLAYIFLVVA